jgi:hypothetical protein
MHKLFTEGTRGEPLKQTDLGPVPKSWNVEPLGGLFSREPSNGLCRPQTDYGRGVLILRIDDFSNDGDIVTTAFAFRMLNSAICKSQIVGMAQSAVAQSSVNQGDVGRLLIPLPPDIQTQDEILTILNALEAKSAVHVRTRGSLNDLFRTLLHHPRPRPFRPRRSPTGRRCVMAAKLSEDKTAHARISADGQDIGGTHMPLGDWKPDALAREPAPVARAPRSRVGFPGPRRAGHRRDAHAARRLEARRVSEGTGPRRAGPSLTRRVSRAKTGRTSAGRTCRSAIGSPTR